MTKPTVPPNGTFLCDEAGRGDLFIVSVHRPMGVATMERIRDHIRRQCALGGPVILIGDPDVTFEHKRLDQFPSFDAEHCAA